MPRPRGRTVQLNCEPGWGRIEIVAESHFERHWVEVLVGLIKYGKVATLPCRPEMHEFETIHTPQGYMNVCKLCGWDTKAS